MVNKEFDYRPVKNSKYCLNYVRNENVYNLVNIVNIWHLIEIKAKPIHIMTMLLRHTVSVR